MGPLGPLGSLGPMAPSHWGVGVGGGFYWGWGGGGWGAPVSRNDYVASREIGGGAGIAGAYKQVGGYARSVKECILKFAPGPCAAHRRGVLAFGHSLRVSFPHAPFPRSRSGFCNILFFF